MKTSFRPIGEPSPSGHSALGPVLARPENLSYKGESPVDMTRIEELRALQPDDPDGLMQELVELFFESAPESLQQARLAVEESAPTVLARAAHFLKGSCAQFGAHRMCKMCSTLEEAGLSGLIGDSTAELLNDTEREFQRVCAALEQYLSAL
jgi:HPt (histidine-containing phosphotransfer) domain-containing protein